MPLHVQNQPPSLKLKRLYDIEYSLSHLLQNPAQVWAGPLQGSARAVVLLNRHKDEDLHYKNSTVTVQWAHLGYAPDLQVWICFCFLRAGRKKKFPPCSGRTWATRPTCRCGFVFLLGLVEK